MLCVYKPASKSYGGKYEEVQTYRCRPAGESEARQQDEETKKEQAGISAGGQQRSEVSRHVCERIRGEQERGGISKGREVDLYV